MNFLRSEFEEALEPMVEDGVIKVGRFNYTGIEIINLAGPEAYNQAFNDWIWDQWIPTRHERKEELMALDSNASRFDDLKSLIAGGRATPFIGSGMSCPTGLPSWADFLRATAKRTKGFSLAQLEKYLAQGKYEAAASRIFGAMPPRLFNERFEGSFAITPSHPVKGAVRLLPYLFDSIVITTNFDSILEGVYGGCDKSFQGILHGMAVGDFRRKAVAGARCLLKLHGDYTAPIGRVLLKNEYDRFYGLRCSGRAELSHIFKGGGLVFFGCSLAHDRTMALLKEIADRDKDMPKHYAFLPRPKAHKNVTAREHFLTERNIFPIWYDGDHDTDIEALLVGLMEDLKKL